LSVDFSTAGYSGCSVIASGWLATYLTYYSDGKVGGGGMVPSSLTATGPVLLAMQCATLQYLEFLYVRQMLFFCFAYL